MFRAIFGTGERCAGRPRSPWSYRTTRTICTCSPPEAEGWLAVVESLSVLVTLLNSVTNKSVAVYVRSDRTEIALSYADY